MNDVSSNNELKVNFRLNGKPHSYSGDPFKRVANVLREDYGLTGTKIGCDAGDCGACTVLIDGEQACGCLVPIAQIDNSEIETVENIQTSELGDALQRSFLHHGAAQCGICTPACSWQRHRFSRRIRSPTVTLSKTHSAASYAAVRDTEISSMLC